MTGDAEVSPVAEGPLKDDAKEINDGEGVPLISLVPEAKPKARLGKKLSYIHLDKGRQRALYETIAVLEAYFDTGQWKMALDKQKQMPKYYRHHYPEYFKPSSRTSAAREKRAVNHAKAAENKAEYESGKRVRTGKNKAIRYERPEIVDIQAERRRRASS